jgi:hypothetical protein
MTRKGKRKNDPISSSTTIGNTGTVSDYYTEGAKGGGKRTTPGIPQRVVTVNSKIHHRAWKDKGSKKKIPSQAQQTLLTAQVMEDEEKAKEQHQGFQRGPPP